MMFQTTIIIGNLGKDPEMRYTPQGQAVTNFSVAVNETYTNSGGTRLKRTIWFRVSAWGKQGEACNEYLKKGSKVMVEGRLIADQNTGGPRIWKSNNKLGTNFEINAQTVRFLSTKSDADDHANPEEEIPESVTSPAEDDIPF